jgi:hypothetical protein
MSRERSHNLSDEEGRMHLACFNFFRDLHTDHLILIPSNERMDVLIERLMGLIEEAPWRDVE